MSNINKQALRESAEKADSIGWDGIEYELDVGPRATEFISRCSPVAVLALLDELEAAQKSNEFLKGQLSELANFNPDWDKLEASYESWREIAAELLVAKERAAEMDDALCQLLPGVQYMDPPDGGSVTPLEQVRRMVADYRERIAELERERDLMQAAALAMRDDMRDARETNADNTAELVAAGIITKVGE